MADRFPLIVDALDSTIKELPQGDNLDLDNSNIVNLNDLAASGTISAAALSSTGTINADSLNITNNILANSIVSSTSIQSDTITINNAATFNSNVAISGTVDATSYTVNGSPLSSIQIQSDWAEEDDQNPAFIFNKPQIVNINELNDIPDVFADSATAGQILEYDGFSWQATTPSSGISLNDLTVEISPTSIGEGDLSYNNLTGTFTFTRPSVPQNVSELVNDLGFVEEGDVPVVVETAGFIKLTDLSTTSPISYNSTTGEIGFDSNAGVNVGTLDSSGAITAPQVNSAVLSNSTDITLTPGSQTNRISISQGFLNIATIGDDSNAQNGDLRFTSDYNLEIYSGNANVWYHIGGQGFNARRGLILPRFTTAERDAIPTPQIGETILNNDTDQLQIYDGTGWLSLNPPP